MPVRNSAKKIRSVVTFFAYRLGVNLPLNETRIMKLAYLAELRTIEKWGRRLTSAQWQNYYYGPYSKEISTALKEAYPDLRMERRITPSGRLGKFYIPNRPEVDLELSKEEFRLLQDVAKDWEYVDNDTLISNTKRSPPFIWTEEEEEIPFDKYQEFIERYKDAEKGDFGEKGIVLKSKKDTEAFVKAL